MLLKVKEEKPMLRTLCGLTHAETELSYFNQRLGPADAMLLAPEISVMASLTRVYVRDNRLGMQDKDVLRKAVEGRSRFECLL